MLSSIAMVGLGPILQLKYWWNVLSLFFLGLLMSKEYVEEGLVRLHDFFDPDVPAQPSGAIPVKGRLNGGMPVDG